MYLYAIQEDGDLFWYRHVGREDGSFHWEGPRQIGTGWGEFEHVFAGGDGIIYAITKVVVGTTSATLEPGAGTHRSISGGNLLWYRHLGRADGTFRWEGPHQVGTGWSNFQHVFSGGNGVIYGITKVVEAGVTASKLGEGPAHHPASGGDLIWYRHVGREDGSFRWEGPKKVGTGWGDLQRVFSGDDGVIYGVTKVVEAGFTASKLGEGPGHHPASGGDLMWYRHLGREDGSFRWEGPKKVGTGWGAMQTLLSDGDGIIYAVTPHEEARVALVFAPGAGRQLPSGDELRWYRHLGHADGRFRWEGPKKVGSGWGGLKQLFSGGRQSPGVVTRWRCGVEDPFNGGIHIASAGAATGRWSHFDLTYRVDPTNCQQMSAAAVNSTIASAFALWQAASPFKFTQKMSGDVDVTLQFGGQNLVDSFGTSGGKSGYAFPPESGTIFFDQAELWNANFLLNVAVHEIGHALGLGHSTKPSSTMYPYVQSPPIDPETKEAIKSIYGWQPQTALGDRGSTEGPSLATAGAASLGSDQTRLYMAWRGVYGDDTVYWSSFDGNTPWTPQAVVPRAGSTHGPALASYPAFRADGVPANGLLMAWDGVPGDDAIYFAVNANPEFDDWSTPQPVAGAGTSARPALTWFNGNMYMAWKGVPGDSTIYWSRLDSTWSTPQPIPGRATSDAPALAVLNNRLYMFWKGIDGDSNAYFAWLDAAPQSIWQVQQRIAYTEAQTGGNVGVSIGTSSHLGAAAQGDAIVLAWKGALTDNALYFNRLRGNDWSGQIVIPGVGSEKGPSAALFQGKLYLAWRGLPGDTGLYYSWV